MKIRGNTIGIPNPQPDWNQTDSTQADYIKNKPGNYVTISPNPPESAPTLWFKPDEYVYTEEAVKTWGELEERVTALEENTGAGGGGAVALDTTLTQRGKAADAKAVGDALAGKQPAGKYLTEIPSGYATEEFVRNKIAEAELGGEEVDLSGYAQKSELPTKVSQLENDKGYLTEHQDISGKLDASALPAAINTALAQAKASGEFDGKDGQDGSPGKDGVSATHTWNGTTLTITSASGTSSANLKGEKGDKGDSIKGDAGADGVSPTVAVSKSGKVTTVSITDKNGTKTATINDGADGSAGKDGTSVTVKSVSESTADGGSNVVTFSDGKTLTIKNGSKGSSGTNGTNGTNGVSVSSVTQTTTSSADGGSNVVTVTLSNGTTSTFTVKNGSKGSTGANGKDGATAAQVIAAMEKETWTFTLEDGSTVTKEVPLV